MSTELPSGYRIVRHSRTGRKFVQTPDNRLIPNQGTRQVRADETDDEIIRDFYVWYRRAFPDWDDPGGIGEGKL